MKVKGITLILTASACFVVLLCRAPVFSKPSDKDEVLRVCAQLYGKPVDEKQHLYEVNRFYVLRVVFDKRDHLEQLAVDPKYYFEESHPDWEEPDDFAYFPRAEYERLLAQLDTIKPKGPLVKPASEISVVTNLTAWHTEIYKNASLTWGELVDIRRAENAPYEVKWFRLNYGKRKR